MLSSIVKEHQTKQAAKREDLGKRGSLFFYFIFCYCLNISLHCDDSKGDSTNSSYPKFVVKLKF